jgi:hypothetical protein
MGTEGQRRRSGDGEAVPCTGWFAGELTMATIIKRIRDGQFVAGLYEIPGHRQITLTRDESKALPVDDATAARICDVSFEGEAHGVFKAGTNARPPEYQRVLVLSANTTGEAAPNPQEKP